MSDHQGLVGGATSPRVLASRIQADNLPASPRAGGSRGGSRSGRRPRTGGLGQPDDSSNPAPVGEGEPARPPTGSVQPILPSPAALAPSSGRPMTGSTAPAPGGEEPKATPSARKKEPAPTTTGSEAPKLTGATTATPKAGTNNATPAVKPAVATTITPKPAVATTITPKPATSTTATTSPSAKPTANTTAPSAAKPATTVEAVGGASRASPATVASAAPATSASAATAKKKLKPRSSSVDRVTGKGIQPRRMSGDQAGGGGAAGGAAGGAGSAVGGEDSDRVKFGRRAHSATYAEKKISRSMLGRGGDVVDRDAESVPVLEDEGKSIQEHQQRLQEEKSQLAARVAVAPTGYQADMPTHSDLTQQGHSFDALLETVHHEFDLSCLTACWAPERDTDIPWHPEMLMVQLTSSLRDVVESRPEAGTLLNSDGITIGRMSGGEVARRRRGYDPSSEAPALQPLGVGGEGANAVGGMTGAPGVKEGGAAPGGSAGGSTTGGGLTATAASGAKKGAAKPSGPASKPAEKKPAAPLAATEVGGGKPKGGKA